MRTLYTILLRLALPFMLARLWWRGRVEPAYREDWDQRLGRYSGESHGNHIWVHAVSVGEARAAEPLVRALRAALPDHRVLVTCTTAAGRETVKQVYGETVDTAWLPYDFPESVQSFLEHFRPRLGVLIETELWPNLVAECASFRVPLLLASARMSEKSARGYERLSGLSRPAFQALGAVCAQSAADAERLSALGARHVEVAGNLKFDVKLDARQLEAGRVWRAASGRPVVLLASSRDGEEALFLDAARPGNELLLIVPRHARRFDEVAQRVPSRRSLGAQPASSDRAYLGDTMGEMAFYYGVCDLAIIGGSFAPLGGQNLIEALAAAVPVIVGPHMFNFAEVTRLALEAGAAVQSADASTALDEAARLLGDPERMKRMSEAGKALCAAHRGATEKHLAACRRLLGL
jgi:3-deoxy-D-manno-octulosonic-acid transferase